MAKKFGKFLVFTAIVGAAAGAYYYLHNKDKKVSDVPEEDEDFDDFDEFDEFDDNDSNGNNSKDTVKERGYVTLDKKLDFSTARDTAKDVFVNVKGKVATVVSKVADVTKSSIHAFEQSAESTAKKETFTETILADEDEPADFVNNIPVVDANPLEKVEEFYDDDSETEDMDIDDAEDIDEEETDDEEIYEEVADDEETDTDDED